MNTNPCERALRWFAPVLLLLAAGCFTKPSPDVAKLICQGDQQCPVGYSCKVKNVPGGCCKDGQQGCGADAAIADVSPVDLRATSDTPPDHSNGDAPASADGLLGRDGDLGMDQSTGGTGGTVDAPATGGSTGGSTGGAGGAGGGTAGGGTGGSGGGGTSTVSQPDGALPDSVSTTPDGSLVTVPDAPPVDAPPDVPPVDAAADATVDAPGTCSADRDCPSLAPLCLGNRCAKCATDSDCIGRTGPACAASGSCVACTAPKHCTGATPKCDTVTNKCTGCLSRSDCSGACQTCAGGACTALKGQDDLGFCAGTCDSTGACKSKRGQACLTVAAGCVAGTTCSPDQYCCDSACTGSCEACDFASSPGICTTLAPGSTPHPGHSANDASNCGLCGHSCIGGTCLSGQCQAVVAVASTGSVQTTLIGVDASYVYYAVPDESGYTSYAYESGKTSTINSGAQIDSVGTSYYQGVIGSQLFFGDHYNSYMCTFNPAATTQCSTSAVVTPGTGLGVGVIVPFKNSSQQYFATNDTYTATYPQFTWYWMSNSTVAQTFGDSISAPIWGYLTPFSFNDAVYWLRALYDAVGTVTEVKLYSASVSKPTLTALSDNMLVDTYHVVDANTVSVLLAGPSGLYRVALPGDAAAAPPLLIGLGSASLRGATEDGNGVYWLQSDGTLFKCTPSACGTSKKALATGQTPIGDLYQDASALYWSNGNQIMRIAK